jgi:hypothetical protein
MTPSEFFTAALSFAQQAHNATGVEVSVILAQWADENGYDWPPPGNNPGNVGNTQHGGQVTYVSIADGVAAYIYTMKLAYYKAVRAPVGWQDQALALGASPWAAGHYGNPPGSGLVDIIETYELMRYDNGGTTPGPPPVTPPSPTLEDMIAPTPSGNGYWLVDSTGAVITRGDAQYLGGPNTSKVNGQWGGPPNLPPGQTVVSVTAHPTAQGYWCESSGGDVYAYGAASWFGNVS